MNIEKTQITLIRWSPKRLTAADVVTIIQECGYDNDSLESGQSDINVVKWEIKVEVARVGGAPIWP